MSDAEARGLGGGEQALPAPLRERFQARAVLGRGSTATVWRALDGERREEVALKVLDPSCDDETRARFLRGARELQGLEHPALLSTRDVGELEGVAFQTCECLEGETLEKAPDLDPVEGMMEIAEGLAELHRRGLTHRDVKPHNLFRTRAGRHLLLDSGLVRDIDRTSLTGQSAVGSLAYMAPELLWGEAATPASDWYAWGVTLYVLLEGELPYGPAELRQALGGKDLPPLEFRKVPEAAAEAGCIRACLAARPDQRPRSPAALRALLESSVPRGGTELAIPLGTTRQVQTRTRTLPMEPSTAGGLLRWLAIFLASAGGTVVVILGLRGLLGR